MENMLLSLVGEAKEGNSEAFGKLFEITYQKAYYTALKIIGNPKDAEDMVQEAYVKAFYSLNTLKDDAKFEKWLNQIVANNCRDFFKKRKHELLSDNYKKDEISPRIEDSIENCDSSVIPEEITDKKAIRTLVRNCINKLPDEQKKCVILFYYNELSVAQISKELGIPEGTVKSRLNKARKSLKRQLEIIERKDSVKFRSLPITLGLSAFFKRIVAGIGIAAVITGGSLAAREVIRNRTYEQAATTSVTLKTKDISKPYVNITKQTTKVKEKTTKAEKTKSKAKKTDVFVLTDEKDNTYYLDEYGIACKEKNGDIFHISFQKPRNLCYYGSLMYIYKGYLYKFSSKDIKKLMKVEGDYLYAANNTLISLSSDSNKAYLIDETKKKCSRFQENSTDFRYSDNTLYFRTADDKVEYALFKKDSLSVKTAVSLKNKGNLKLPYVASNNNIYYTNAGSDQTGLINIKSIKSQKVKRVNLGYGIKDFYVNDKRIYFSSTEGGLYYFENGKASKIADGNYYCSSYSNGNMIWCSSVDDKAFLIKKGKTALVPIENGNNIIDFSLNGDTLLFWGEKGFNYTTISQ